MCSYKYICEDQEFLYNHSNHYTVYLLILPAERCFKQKMINACKTEHCVNLCFLVCVLPVRRVRWRPRTLKLSMRGVRIPCMVPNMVLRPRLSNIRKNSVDQKGLAGKRAITSVNAMNARPVPSTPCAQTKGRQRWEREEV